MCGIAGIIHKKDSDNSGKDAVLRALDLMQHRGPDYHRAEAIGRYVLGHTRLAILDLNERSHQPMQDPTGRFTLVFNGEIFNYHDLRAELEKKGTTFKTTSDTEVLLQLLIHEGTECLNKLNGFFAFVFVDTAAELVIMARDRFGEKPLWYSDTEKTVYFASEMKAMRAFPINKEIDTDSLRIYLQLSYIPAPHSIYKDIKKLEPGYFFCLRNGEQIIQKWYNPSSESIPESGKEQEKQLDELLQDAVKIRLNADVPLGALLSGGVDSSVVAMHASRQNPKLQTFSLGYEDAPFLDETGFAKSVAAHLGTRHHAIKITNHDLLQSLQATWMALDEPFADSSAIALYALSHVVKNEVKVALSGDGADELFAGYNKHLALYRSMHSNSMSGLYRILYQTIKWLPSGRKGFLSNKTRQAQRYFSGLSLPAEQRYLYWASFAEQQLVDKLIRQHNQHNRDERLRQLVQHLDPGDFQSVLEADQHLVLSNDMLVKADLMTMANSIELRPVFMDHRVVEFVNGLPVQQKINRSERKVILKNLYAKQLPAHVFNRSKKGFEVPLENWLRGPIKSMVDDLISREKLDQAGFFNTHEVLRIKSEFYLQKKGQHASLIYALLVFQWWYFRQH